MADGAGEGEFSRMNSKIEIEIALSLCLFSFQEHSTEKDLLCIGGDIVKMIMEMANLSH